MTPESIKKKSVLWKDLRRLTGVALASGFRQGAWGREDQPSEGAQCGRLRTAPLSSQEAFEGHTKDIPEPEAEMEGVRGKECSVASGEALGTQAAQQGSTSAPDETVGSAHFRQGRKPSMPSKPAPATHLAQKMSAE